MLKFFALLFLLPSLSLFGQELKRFPFDCLDSPVKIIPFKPCVSYNFTIFKDTIGKFDKYEDLNLILDRRVVVKYDYFIKGIRMYLYNPNDSAISFKAPSRNLVLLCEAKDTNGNWVLIEEPKSTFWYCPVGGSSLETEKYDLKKREYIKLIAPCYTGSFKTELRYKLIFGEGTETTVYSEEFEGYINEGQLYWE